MMVRSALGFLVIGIAAVGCEREGGGLADPPPPTCFVDDDPATETQALARIPFNSLEVVLATDDGGPLRCRPNSSSCVALLNCIGDVVDAPIGVEHTLVVGVRALGTSPITTRLDVRMRAESDAAFTLLQPTPVELPVDEGAEVAILLSVTPQTEEVLTAVIDVRSDAENMPDDGSPVSITVHVAGVPPDAP